jgi:hypothetical protein
VMNLTRFMRQRRADCTLAIAGFVLGTEWPLSVSTPQWILAGLRYSMACSLLQHTLPPRGLINGWRRRRPREHAANSLSWSSGFVHDLVAVSSSPAGRTPDHLHTNSMGGSSLSSTT